MTCILHTICYILSRDARNIPYCDGCPEGMTLAVYDHCKKTVSNTNDPTPLLEYAKRQSAAGTIDDLANLTAGTGKRVFLYRGTVDECYLKGAVNATANFFRALLPEGNVFFEHDVQSAHLLPGIDPCVRGSSGVDAWLVVGVLG